MSAAPADGSALAQTAAARGRAYLLFAEALEYPDGALHRRVVEGSFAIDLQGALAGIDPALLADVDETALANQVSEDDFQVEHTRLFDTAASKAACHLHEGGYVESKDQALEESLRFYDFFGLSLSEASRELPDYLVTQLEFLHYLAYCQSEANARGGESESFRLAEQDFIERHPGRWVPKLNLQMQRMQPMPFFSEALRLLERLLKLEQQRQ